MSSELSIRVENLGKSYHIYDQPRDRLKQFIIPKFQRLFGKNPHQYYREFWALKDVSFEIKKGETVGIIGLNGSGKSTLLQIICGTVPQTSGIVETQGRVAALLELGAGFNPDFSGRENVMLNAAILGFPKHEILARIEDILAFSELGNFLDQPVKTYSSGMHSRLAFSIAIHVDPDLLIIDEALAVGDARFVAKCMRRIKEIQKTGATILFVSHDVSSVRTLCERAIWLDQGRLIDQGDVFPITGRYMEFMFRDELAPSPILDPEVTSNILQEPSDIIVVTQNIDQPHADHADEAVPTTGDVIAKLDARPVTHWGSHKGIITSASIRDDAGIQRDVFEWGDKINVQIEVSVPLEISRDHLSIAFSIKDLKGTDLIVSTAHDFECKRLPDECNFKVLFKLSNHLLNGKYLLVAAVENRQHTDIHYYEYIEGAHYFSSSSTARLFGIFQPSIDQLILAQ